MKYLRLLVLAAIGVLPVIGCVAPADNDRDPLQLALRDLAHHRIQECTDITIVLSAEEIKEFVDNCIVQRIDLDLNGRLDAIVDYTGEMGQKGDRAFYLLLHSNGGYKPIGELYGNMYQLEYGSPEVGFPDILTVSYAGGHKYVTSHYRYDGRLYRVHKAEKWMPEPVSSGEAARLSNLADELARHLDALRANPAQSQVFKVIGECEKIREAHGHEAVANALKQIALRKPDLREQALSFLWRYVSLVEHGDFLIELKLIELKTKKQ